MAAEKILSVTLYLLSSTEEPVTLLAHLDHVRARDRRDKHAYAKVVGTLIRSDPPMTMMETGVLGGFRVVESDQHQIIYGADGNGICLAVTTVSTYPHRTSIQMLQELYKEISQMITLEKLVAAKENELSNKDIRPILSSACAKYDNLDSVDKVSAVQGKVDAVKTQMDHNITTFLNENMVLVDSIEKKSAQTLEAASVFKTHADRLRKRMAWKDLKFTLMLGGFALIILIVILAPLPKK